MEFYLKKGDLIDVISNGILFNRETGLLLDHSPALMVDPRLLGSQKFSKLPYPRMKTGPTYLAWSNSTLGSRESST